MRAQREKNMETLLEEIEKCSEQPITNAIADRLSAYRGAYKAICMVEHHHEEKADAKAVKTATLDGDTDFEKLMGEIPIDEMHVKAVYSILSDHMESLKVMNHRAYDNLMLKLYRIAEK